MEARKKNYPGAAVGGIVARTELLTTGAIYKL